MRRRVVGASDGGNWNLIKRFLLSHITLYGRNKIKNLFLQFLSKGIVNTAGLFIVSTRANKST